MTLNSARFGVVWINELSEHVNTWLISTKNAVRLSNSSRAIIVLLKYLRRIDPAVLRRCVSLRESSDVVDTRTSFRPSTASSSRAQNLNRIDQCTAEEDEKELGDSRRKIMLRYAAKASYTGSSKRRRIHCGCAGDCRSARCVCYKND